LKAITYIELMQTVMQAMNLASKLQGSMLDADIEK
jgi:hypothetical protein